MSRQFFGKCLSEGEVFVLGLKEFVNVVVELLFGGTLRVFFGQGGAKMGGGELMRELLGFNVQRGAG